MGSHMLLTPSDGEHPGTVCEGRLVPYVLPMTAGQISDPITEFILMISNDRLLHGVMILVCRMGV